MEIQTNDDTERIIDIPEFESGTGPRAGHYIEVYGTIEDGSNENSQELNTPIEIKGLIKANEIYIYR